MVGKDIFEFGVEADLSENCIEECAVLKHQCVLVWVGLINDSNHVEEPRSYPQSVEGVAVGEESEEVSSVL